VCIAQRRRRNRLLGPKDTRVHQPFFLGALFVHQHNEPKYHALLLRAVEHAKRGGQALAQILWVVAQYSPLNPEEFAASLAQMEVKRQR